MDEYFNTRQRSINELKCVLVSRSQLFYYCRTDAVTGLHPVATSANRMVLQSTSDVEAALTKSPDLAPSASPHPPLEPISTVPEPVSTHGNLRTIACHTLDWIRLFRYST